ncbi:YitT family protein [Alteribacillus sp. YIM 98480]|uniref:YczE/YyaS/YitT family protein n=1 Tax=Alteribacillus sp. YIM 98480 TaxID=2606599 RepID=UPI00131B3934|nr:hypothetical protein [Alteribacillus sp. YIM 98480]
MLGYRIFLYLAGMIINFLGVALIVKSDVGAGFWTAFFVSITEHAGMTAGFWYGLFQMIFIFVNARLLGFRPEWAAIVPLVLEAIILDFWLEVVFHSVHLQTAPILTKFTVFSCGLLLVSLGVAIYILPRFTKAPVDQLFLSMSERFDWSVRKSQTILALMVTSLAVLLGGPVGVGTIITTFLLGPLIQFWQVKVQHWYTPPIPETFITTDPSQ